MTPTTPTTRRPGQKRTAAEKVADGQARRDAQKAKAVVPVENTKRGCSAPKCEELRSTKRGILCATHERMWRTEGFRLTPEGTKRAKARLADQAKARAARAKGKATKRPAAEITQIPVAAQADEPPAHAIAAFASIDLAKKQITKRRTRQPAQT